MSLMLIYSKYFIIIIIKPFRSAKCIARIF